MVSIGKLHFRGLPQDDHGFTEEVIPMHVVEGKGDLPGLIRAPASPPRRDATKPAAMAGQGESDHTRHDSDITAAVRAWLREKASRQDRPWCLFVSLVAPRFPLTAPPGVRPNWS